MRLVFLLLLAATLGISESNAICFVPGFYCSSEPTNETEILTNATASTNSTTTEKPAITIATTTVTTATATPTSTMASSTVMGTEKAAQKMLSKFDERHETKLKPQDSYILYHLVSALQIFVSSNVLPEHDMDLINKN